MHRHINLRQIEAFKAMIEFGTVSRSAEMLNVSQPAMSQLIAHLEADTGLKLFDRVKGRLAPTERAMRLYEEVSRIFAGVRQVENAVEVLRREEQERLAIGVMPALAGTFIQRATTGFLSHRPNVFCWTQSLGSHLIVDWLGTGKLDIGLIEAGLDSPYVNLEPLMEHSLVCAMAPDHPLTAKSLIEPQDLDQIAFVSLNSDSYIGRRIETMFETYNIRPKIGIVANVAPTICEYVAAGLGVALVHPLMLSGLEQRLTLRRFEPEIFFHFQLGHSINSRNVQLVEAFAQELRTVADEFSRSMLS